MTPRRPEKALNARANQEPKPWTPPATKKTNLERSISYVGALVSEDLKHNFDDSMTHENRLISGGPNGPPVLDRFGYRISRSKVMKSNRPRRRRMSMKEIMQETEESRRITELMGVPREKCSAMTLSYFKDQVARDLDIPYHTVGIAEYEEWGRRGFKMDPKLWHEKPSEEESERLLALMTGSAFRE